MLTDAPSAGPWTRALKSAAFVDGSKVALVPAARSAVGIALPLLVGGLSGHLLIGVDAAVGALTAGMASLQGTYRSRIKIMVFAVIAFAFSAFIGAAIGHLEGPDIAITALWGIAAGFSVLLGPSVSVIGLQAVLGLVIFSHFSLGTAQAASNAAWALCGGALQIALVALTWPLQHFPEERAASSAAFRKLAGYLRAVAGDPSRLMEPNAFEEIRVALRETQPWGDRAAAAAYRALADEAERMRLEAAGVASARSRLLPSPRTGTEGDNSTLLEAASQVDTAILAAADLLIAAAEALHDGRVVAPDPRDGKRYRDSLDRLGAIVDSAASSRQDAIARALEGLTAMAGQLRSIAQLATVAAGKDPNEPLRPDRTPYRSRSGPAPMAVSPYRRRLEVIRANLNLESDAMRHALRLGATLAAAVAISHLFPSSHAYWLTLTVMLVLQPDFAATLSRGLARSVGTVLGAALVTLLLAALAPSAAGLGVLTVVLYAISIAMMRANYFVYSIGIASLVVILLSFTGSPVPSAAAERALYTVLGAILALVAYVVWPSWERARVPERLAAMVEAYGNYGASLLHGWADPASADRAAISQLRLAARRSRSTAEASVDRWLSEPAGIREDTDGRLDADTARSILAAVRRFVWGTVALYGRLPSAGPIRGDLHQLAREVAEALGIVAATLRTGAKPSNYPPLRTTQVALATQLLHPPTESGADRAPTAEEILLLSETDLMVNAINTLAHLLGADI